MSIGSLLSGVVNKVKSAISDAPAPAPAAPPPPPPLVVPESHQSGFSPAPVGGRGSINNVEQAVAARADRDTPMNLTMTTQHERLNNLSRLTQVDGDPKSQSDLLTCGPQSVVAGLYLKNPTALPKVAEYLLTKKGDKLDGWAKDNGMDPKKARADLAAIQSGKASPRQISTMTQLLMSDMKDRVPGGLAALGSGNPQVGPGGTDMAAMKLLTRDILTRDAGVEVPPMRLELRDVSTSGNVQGHWVAEYDVASMADIEENAKNDMVVTFDPWPREGGKATTGVSISRNGADKLLPGKPLQEVTVKPNGDVKDTSLSD